MKQRAGIINPYGIHNTAGEKLTLEYIAEYISGYCRPIDQFSTNRKANMAYFKSNQFLSKFPDRLVTEVAKAAKNDPRWGITVPENTNRVFAQTVMPVRMPTRIPAIRPVQAPVPVSSFIMYNGTPLPVNQAVRLAQQEVKKLAERILSDFGITRYDIRLTSTKVSHHSFDRNPTEYSRHKITFGSQSIIRALGAFKEYKSVQYITNYYKSTGMHGLRMLVIHEVAHAVCTAVHGRQLGDSHGRNFQSVYSQLLAAYAERK